MLPCKRHRDGKAHTYYALLESIRTEAARGRLSGGTESRPAAALATHVFYNRQGDSRQLRLFPDDDQILLPDHPDVVRIRLSSVGWTDSRSFGDVWLVQWLWNWLHLDEIAARHLLQGRETVAPAEIVAIEVINRLCGPCSQFAMKYDLLLYDLTNTCFEGFVEDNELARRGYSRDYRSDCVQVVQALVVTREGFLLAHLILEVNTRNLQTVEKVVTAVESQFGKSHRVWVMDRGMISKQTLAFLSQPGRHYLLALRRSEVSEFKDQHGRQGWQRMEEHPEVEVKMVPGEEATYLLSRSRPRRKKERAIRRRQRRGLALALQRLQQQVTSGHLKKRDMILERVGRLRERSPKARPS